MSVRLAAVWGHEAMNAMGVVRVGFVFCLMIQRRSEITSFKANRFNNIFEASAALHFLQSDITTLLDTCMTGGSAS